MEKEKNYKTTILLIGGVIGLVSGLAAAYLVIKNREETGQTLKLTSGDGARIGMGIANVLKMVAESGK
jgi:hypothetical protein